MNVINTFITNVINNWHFWTFTNPATPDEGGSETGSVQQQQTADFNDFTEDDISVDSTHPNVELHEVDDDVGPVGLDLPNDDDWAEGVGGLEVDNEMRDVGGEASSTGSGAEADVSPQYAEQGTVGVTEGVSTEAGARERPQPSVQRARARLIGTPEHWMCPQCLSIETRQLRCGE